MASVPASSNFTCYYPGCPKTFASKFNLRRHINVSHLEIKAYACPMCGKKLASKQNVKEHLYTHTGEKPFQCLAPGCGKRFRQASHLSFHKKTHVGRRVMEMCEATSSSVSLLSLLACCVLEDTPFLLSKNNGGSQALPPLRVEPRADIGKLPIAAGLLDSQKSH